ncbi:MAG: GIDE domain-containing protein [bacterium]
MIILIVGVVLIAAGVGCLFGRKRESRKMSLLAGTEVSTVKSLYDIYGSIGETLGGDMESASLDMVSVQGTVECNDPLISPKANVSCVYFRSLLEREVERKEIRTTTDKDGKTTQETEWVRSWDTISDDQRNTEFRINDGTASISIKPAGANIDVETKVMDQYDREAPQGLRGVIGTISSDRRVLGYRTREWCLKVGQRSFVLGAIQPAGRDLCIGAPSERDKMFLITDKSRDQVVQASKTAQKFWLVGAIALFVIGAALVIIGPFIA